MFRQRNFYAVSATLFLCWPPNPQRAHAQAASTDTVYHLHGTVVDGVTGKPIARALVEASDRRLAVMSDREGRFSADIAVPVRSASAAATAAGPEEPLDLTAEKPGYLPPPQTTALVLNESLSSTDIRVKLMPGGVITGHVSAAGVDSAANIQVLLYARVVNDEGRRSYLQAGAANTKAGGEFRFAELRPGEYTVATATWTAEGEAPEPADVPSQRFPATYLGDTGTMDAALKLHVRYGETATADLHLHQVTYYPVTIPLKSVPPNANIGASIKEGFQLNYDSRTGMLEGALPNGHYDAVIVGSATQSYFGVVSLTVANAAVRTPPATLTPAAGIPIRVHTQFTKPQPPATPETQVISTQLEAPPGAAEGPPSRRERRAQPALQLYVRGEDSSGYVIGASQPEPGSGGLSLQGVPPGRYTVGAVVYRGYAASITSGGVDLRQRPLVVNASGGAPPIDVILRDDTATLSGTVTNGGSPLPPSTAIAFLPTDSAAQINYSDAGADGKFSVPNLVPGSYRILAFRASQRRLPYRDPEAMQQYEGKGKTFTVTPGQALKLDVPLLDEPDAETN